MNGGSCNQGWRIEREGTRTEKRLFKKYEREKEKITFLLNRHCFSGSGGSILLQRELSPRHTAPTSPNPYDVELQPPGVDAHPGSLLPAANDPTILFPYSSFSLARSLTHSHFIISYISLLYFTFFFL